MNGRGRGGIKTLLVFMFISGILSLIFNSFGLILVALAYITRSESPLGYNVIWPSLFSILFLSLVILANVFFVKYKSKAIFPLGIIYFAFANNTILSIFYSVMPYKIINIVNFILLLSLGIYLTIGYILKNRIVLKIGFIFSAVISFLMIGLELFATIPNLGNYDGIYAYFVVFNMILDIIIFIILFIVSWILFYSTNKKVYESDLERYTLGRSANVFAGATAQLAFNQGMISKTELNDVMDSLDEEEKEAVSFVLKDEEAKKELQTIVNSDEFKKGVEEYKEPNKPASNYSNLSYEERDIMMILDKNQYHSKDNVFISSHNKLENKEVKKYRCSNCKEIFEGKVDKCPHCGAKINWNNN